MYSQLEFEDTSFPLEDQSLSCSSSSASFSTVSSASEAYTPPSSGRSTPRKQRLTPSSMDYEAAQVMGYHHQLTPQSSGSMSGYFPHDMKADFSQPQLLSDVEMMGTPTRRSSMPVPHGLDINLAGSIPSSFHQNLQHAAPQPQFGEYFHSHPEVMGASPPYVTTAPPSFHGEPPMAHDMSPTSEMRPSDFAMWQHMGDGSVPGYFDQPVLSHPGHLTPSRRPHFLDEAQSKTSALHQIQYGGRPSYLRAGKKTLGGNVKHIPAGTHRCNYPGCTSKPFKRQEHLKRHKDTKHNSDGGKGGITCEFCGHGFNRRDNYRQHLRLHTLKDRPTTRTRYVAEAEALYREEEKKTKHRHPMKKSTVSKLM